MEWTELIVINPEFFENQKPFLNSFL